MSVLSSSLATHRGRNNWTSFFALAQISLCFKRWSLNLINRKKTVLERFSTTRTVMGLLFLFNEIYFYIPVKLYTFIQTRQETEEDFCLV